MNNKINGTRILNLNGENFIINVKDVEILSMSLYGNKVKYVFELKHPGFSYEFEWKTLEGGVEPWNEIENYGAAFLGIDELPEDFDYDEFFDNNEDEFTDFLKSIYADIYWEMRNEWLFEASFDEIDELVRKTEDFNIYDFFEAYKQAKHIDLYNSEFDWETGEYTKVYEEKYFA